MLFKYPRKVKKTLKSAKTLSGDVYSFFVRDAGRFIYELYFQMGMPLRRIRLVDEEKQLKDEDVLSSDVLYSIIVLDQVTFDGVSPCHNENCHEIHEAYTPFLREDGVWVHDPYDEYDYYERWPNLRESDSVLTVEESWSAMEQDLERNMAKNNIPILPQTIFEVDVQYYRASCSSTHDDEKEIKYYLRKEDVGWSHHICMTGDYKCTSFFPDVIFQQPCGFEIHINHHD